MNTEAIKAYARAKILANGDMEDEWFSFDDNWDINIWWEGSVDSYRVGVYPVIDKQVQTDYGFVYTFVVEV